MRSPNVVEALKVTSLELIQDNIGQVDIDGIKVDAFPTLHSMLDRIVCDIRNPGQANIFSVNVHGSNIARKNSRFRKIMQSAKTMICDGAGIRIASKILPVEEIPCRLAAGDYLPALLQRLADEKLTAFFLAGEPGVAESALKNLATKVPNHTVLGCHHGYIFKDKELEAEVISKINALQPDILFVGFGMPLQEFWIQDNMHQLKVKAFFPFGATLDYLSNKVKRCPTWLGDLGLEWLFRFCLEPKRMFERYIFGNPEFLLRIFKQSIALHLQKNSIQNKHTAL